MAARPEAISREDSVGASAAARERCDHAAALSASATDPAFRAGLTRIVTETPVPVIPMAIAGLWGSMFSRRTPKIWQRLPRKLWHRVVVNVGESVAPEDAVPEELRERVCALYGAFNVP